ncbi:type I-U CRISPR-associated protein Csb2 [Stomatohabitans albus]|uniref:type I-G CRISPR-associated protein Csb2 n=1 Tax=Stomatohabitans albus TaxID=3110766 RepID=UPI00300CA7DA
MRFGIRVDFLTRRYIATDAFNRTGHEWPAHPSRLFSACVAALHDDDEVNLAEAEALRWLSTLGAPKIVASEASARAVVTHFVPTNDATVMSASQLVTKYNKIGDATQALAMATTGAKKASALKKIGAARDVTKLIAWDEKIGKNPKVDLLPEERNKQARNYPSVTPKEPVQWFIWDGVEEHDVLQYQGALNQVLARVTRLGHSSSFVAVSIGQCAQTPNWVPDKQGGHVLRTFEAGQLERLEQAFVLRSIHATQRDDATSQFNDVDPRIMPHTLTAYYHGEPNLLTPAVSTEAGEWMAFEYVEGKRFSVKKTWDVCRAFRNALLAHAPNPRSPYLSGHEADGSPTSKPHIKIIAPAFVQFRHATGAGMGVVLILPEPDDQQDRLNVYQAIGAWEQANDDSQELGTVRLFSSGGDRTVFKRNPTSRVKTLQLDTWRKPSSIWVTTTPIVLDRNPKHFGHASASKHDAAATKAIDSIVRACRDQGLPEPVSVQVQRQPFFSESYDCKRFDPIEIGGRRRFLIHARIQFKEPVQGPLVLGAGRFFGMGLCAPEVGR